MSMGRSILSNWMGMVLSGAISFALTPLLIHHLGATFFGIWVLAASLLDYSGLFDNSMRVAMFRYIARYSGADDREGLNHTLATSLTLSAASAGLLLLLLGPITIYLPRFFLTTHTNLPVFRATLVLIGVSLALMFPSRVLGAYMAGVRRFDLYNVGALATVAVRSAWIAVALWTDHGLLSVAWATCGAAIIALGLNAYLVKLADPELRLDWRGVNRARATELLNYALYAFGINCGEQLRNYTDSAVIGRVLTVALITPFAVAARLIEYCRQIVVAGLGPLMGRMSELDGRGDRAELERVYLRASRYVAFASIFLGGMLVLDGKALIQSWIGPSVATSYGLLVCLVIGYVPAYIQGTTQNLLMALGKHRFIAVIRVAEGVTNLVLSVYWARRWGLLGVAAGTTVPLLVTQLTIEPLYCFRVLGLRPARFVRESLARPVLACSVWLAICLPLRTTHLDWVHFALAATLHGLAFALITVALGLSGGERQFLRARIGGLLRRQRSQHSLAAVD